MRLPLYFPRILREWAAARRAHAGVILVYGIDHSEFGPITRGVGRWLQLRPDATDWSAFPAILDRGFAGREPNSPVRRPIALETATGAAIAWRSATTSDVPLGVEERRR